MGSAVNTDASARVSSVSDRPCRSPAIRACRASSAISPIVSGPENEASAECCPIACRSNGVTQVPARQGSCKCGATARPQRREPTTRPEFKGVTPRMRDRPARSQSRSRRSGRTLDRRSSSDKTSAALSRLRDCDPGLGLIERHPTAMTIAAGMVFRRLQLSALRPFELTVEQRDVSRRIQSGRD